MVEYHTMGRNMPLSMVNDPVGSTELQRGNVYENSQNNGTLLLTLPSDPSSNFTGQSLTEARKQKAEGSSGIAVGYHSVPRTFPDCGNRRTEAAAITSRAGKGTSKGEKRVLHIRKRVISVELTSLKLQF